MLWCTWSLNLVLLQFSPKTLYRMSEAFISVIRNIWRAIHLSLYITLWIETRTTIRGFISNVLYLNISIYFDTMSSSYMNCLPFRSIWVHPPVFSGVRVTRSLFLCFVDRCLSFFFWRCLFFFDLRILITPLVSLKSSYNKWWNEQKYHTVRTFAKRNRKRSKFDTHTYVWPFTSQAWYRHFYKKWLD